MTMVQDADRRVIDYLLVVGLLRNEEGNLIVHPAKNGKNPVQNLSPDFISYKPGVLGKWPTKDHSDRPITPMLHDIPEFVFPHDTRPRVDPVKEGPYCFSFVLTTQDYAKYYIVCIVTYERETISGKDPSTSGEKAYYLPKAFCLVSEYPFLGTCRKLLIQILHLLASAAAAPTGSPTSDVRPLQAALGHLLYATPLPPHNAQSLLWGAGCLPLVSAGLGCRDFSFRPLFACLSVRNITYLWFLLLLEKKLIIACRKRSLSILTIIAETLKALLFPFRWFHVYIPVLPRHMWVVLQCPTPFFVGVHHNSIADLVKSCPPDVVIFDLDRDEVIVNIKRKTDPSKSDLSIQDVDEEIQYSELECLKDNNQEWNAVYGPHYQPHSSHHQAHSSNPEQYYSQGHHSSSYVQQQEGVSNPYANNVSGFTTSKNCPAFYNDILGKNFVSVPLSLEKIFNIHLKQISIQERRASNNFYLTYYHLVYNPGIAPTNAAGIHVQQKTELASPTQDLDDFTAGVPSSSNNYMGGASSSNVGNVSAGNLGAGTGSGIPNNTEGTISHKSPNSPTLKSNILNAVRSSSKTSTTSGVTTPATQNANPQDENALLWSESAECKFRVKIQALFLEVILRLFWNYRDFLVKSKDGTSTREKDVLRYSFDDEQFLSEMPRALGRTIVNQGDVETITALTAQFLSTNSWDSFLNEAVIGGFSMFHELCDQYRRHRRDIDHTVYSTNDEGQLLIDALRRYYTTALYEPRHSIVTPASSALTSSPYSGTLDAVNNIFQPNIVNTTAPHYYQIIPHYYRSVISYRTLSQLNLHNAWQNSCLFRYFFVTSPDPAEGQRASRRDSVPPFLHWRLSSNAAELFCLAMGNFLQNRWPNALFPKVIRKLAMDTQEEISNGDEKFRIFCCLLGICEVSDAPFWKVMQKAFSSKDTRDPLIFEWKGKLITPTLTLSLDVPTFEMSDAGRKNNRQRVFAFRNFLRVLARLEDEDLSRTRSDTLKLQAPDLYFSLYVFFSLRVEAYRSEISANNPNANFATHFGNGDDPTVILSMAELCRQYIDNCTQEEPATVPSLESTHDKLGNLVYETSDKLLTLPRPTSFHRRVKSCGNLSPHPYHGAISEYGQSSESIPHHGMGSANLKESPRADGYSSISGSYSGVTSKYGGFGPGLNSKDLDHMNFDKRSKKTASSLASRSKLASASHYTNRTRESRGRDRKSSSDPWTRYTKNGERLVTCVLLDDEEEEPKNPSLGGMRLPVQPKKKITTKAQQSGYKVTIEAKKTSSKKGTQYGQHLQQQNQQKNRTRVKGSPTEHYRTKWDKNLKKVELTKYGRNSYFIPEPESGEDVPLAVVDLDDEKDGIKRVSRNMQSTTNTMFHGNTTNTMFHGGVSQKGANIHDDYVQSYHTVCNVNLRNKYTQDRMNSVMCNTIGSHTHEAYKPPEAPKRNHISQHSYFLQGIKNQWHRDHASKYGATSTEEKLQQELDSLNFQLEVKMKRNAWLEETIRAIGSGTSAIVSGTSKSPTMYEASENG